MTFAPSWAFLASSPTLVCMKCIAVVAEACRKHDKLFMLGGIGDLTVVKSLMPLGIAPLYQTGTDTDMLFAAAEQRTKRLLDWHNAG